MARLVVLLRPDQVPLSTLMGLAGELGISAPVALFMAGFGKRTPLPQLVEAASIKDPEMLFSLLGHLPQTVLAVLDLSLNLLREGWSVTIDRASAVVALVTSDPEVAGDVAFSLLKVQCPRLAVLVGGNVSLGASATLFKLRRQRYTVVSEGLSEAASEVWGLLAAN